ncbi:hypothetical protein M902_1928 [Bacteriovorax sp. BAL6_X]|uniref:hypothetical protein n=1 Tax=Bacteriovorax sp. BAL6_X TaxID=1201290 RepID=UPI0003854E42|nr:hypothetical protein [Bacteriovorax sp. BAL6_X]EPZ52316.1 hypothetical protein M902_1928 [Bacteriovorax sp. BAL6_X]
MKSITFLILITLSLISASVSANFILPEISRDGKSLNTSVISVSQEKRNFTAIKYEFLSVKSDATPAVEIKQSSPGILGGFSTNSFSGQFNMDIPTYDVEGVKNHATNFSFLGGYQVNNKLTLGIGYTKSELDISTDENVIAAGGSLKVKDKVLGGSVEYVENKTSNTKGGFFVLSAGFGQQDAKNSVEAGVQLMTEGSGDLTVGKRFALFSSMTKVVNGIEIDGSFTYEFGNYLNVNDNALDGNNYNALFFEFDAEFLVGSNFYITPGINYSAENAPGISNDTSNVSLKSDFGYRTKRLDATIGASYVFIGEENDIDYDGLGWSLNIGYKL